MNAWLLIMSLGSAQAGLWEDVKSVRNDLAAVDRSVQDQGQIQQLVSDLVRSAPSGVLPADASDRAADAGLHLERKGELVILRSNNPEQSDGYTVIRLGEAAPLVLQAPHAWYDLRTGKAACELFEMGFGRALMLNTSHRYRGEAPVEGAVHADLAHRSDTAYQAITIGLARGLEDALFVQLHGFSGADSGLAVVSEGSVPTRPTDVEAVRQALRGVLGDDIRTGSEAPRLAGTTNHQGRAIAGRARFLHLELSKPVREALTSTDPKQRQALGELLTALAEPR